MSISIGFAREPEDPCLGDGFGVIGTLGSGCEYLAKVIDGCNDTEAAPVNAQGAGSIWEVVTPNR